MENKTQQTNANMSVIQTRPNKAALIRALLKQKKSPKQIAEEVGCKPQYIYCVRTADRVKAKKAKAKRAFERKKAVVAGAVKRKYVKSGKYAKKVKSAVTDKSLMLELDRNRLKDEMNDLNEFNEQLIKQIQEATKPRIQYIEVEVPQPHYNLTWGQRFKALFTGRV